MSTDASGLAETEILSSAWHNVFNLARREADDRDGLEQRLKAFCAEHEGASVGLYREIDGELCLWLCSGAATLPACFTPDGGLPDGPDGPWRRFELPGVALIHDAATDDPAPMLLLMAGARISQLKKQIQEQSFEAMFRGVELEALYEVGLAIASTLDLEKLGDEVLMRAALLLDARRAALYLLDGEDYQLTSRFGGSALETFTRRNLDVATWVAGRADADTLLPGACHYLAVPVEIEGDPRGLLVVGDKESRTGVGPFAAKDRRTLSLFANQAAIALENAKLHRMALEKERLEREMELAAEIQQQILPKTMPEIPGFDVIGWNRPAQQVGGDYFDFQGLEDGRWGLVVGDVTGKGMPAALLVSTLHSALRVLLDRMEAGPALIERLNRHIYESSSANKFITMLVAFLDSASGALTYINAGHNPGVLLRRDGRVEKLSAKGLPLGLLPGGTYGSDELVLGPDDLVCIYSDGITECESPDEEEEYGLERLVSLLRQSREAPLPEILRRIDQTMLDWADGRPQGDDQTVILLRRQ